LERWIRRLGAVGKGDLGGYALLEWVARLRRGAHSGVQEVRT